MILFVVVYIALDCFMIILLVFFPPRPSPPPLPHLASAANSVVHEAHVLQLLDCDSDVDGLTDWLGWDQSSFPSVLVLGMRMLGIRWRCR
jgi:hypothetical protein